MRARQVTNSKLRKLLTGTEAQDLVEYGLAISLIALALIGGMNRVATALLNAFTNISTTLTPVASPPSGGHDYLIYPGPFHGMPGFEPAPSGIVLAAWEPAADPHTGLLNRHAAAFGQSTQSFAAGDRVRPDGDRGRFRLRLADSGGGLVREA